MTRTGTDYLRGGIVRQWTITEIRPRVFQIVVNGVVHATGKLYVVRRFLAE